MEGHGRTTEKERSGQTLKEVWENSPSRHTRIPKKTLSKMNTKAKLRAEKCDEFEGFRADKAKIGPQAGSLAQHKLYWVVLGQACRRGRVSLSRKPSKNSVCVCVCVCVLRVGGSLPRRGREHGKSQGRGDSMWADIWWRDVSAENGDFWVREPQRAAVIWGLLELWWFALSMASRCWVQFSEYAKQTSRKWLKIC